MGRLKQIFKSPFSRASHSALIQESVGPIGLEIGLEYINLVQLSRRYDSKLYVRAWNSIPYEIHRDALMASPKDLKALLETGFKCADFKGRSVVTVIPADELKIMTVTYQSDAQKNNDEAIVTALSDRVEGELSDYVVDYLPVRGSMQETQHTAMVAIAKRDKVIAYLELLRRAGLEVGELEIGPAAIRRLVASMTNPIEGEGALVINCGFQQSYLTVISGQRLLLDEEVDFGEASVVTSVAETLEMTTDQIRTQLLQHGIGTASGDRSGAKTEAPSVANCRDQIAITLKELMAPKLMKLVDEINRVLIYSASETHGEQVKRIYLIGSIARWPRIDEFLSQLLGMTVIGIPDPLLPFRQSAEDTPAFDGEPAPQLVIATGLALRGFENHVRN